MYSGDKNTSLGEGSPGYGVEITISNDGYFLIPFFSSSLSMINSKQSFLDSATPVTSNFTYYGAEADVGLLLFPLSRRTKGFNTFLSGAGIVGYNFIALSKSTVLTSIPHNDQSFSAGYSAGLGAEWILGEDKKKWSLLAKVEYKSASSTLLKRTFDLNRVCLSLGMGW